MSQAFKHSAQGRGEEGSCPTVSAAASALSDPVRRRMLVLLSRGTAKVDELAEQLGTSGEDVRIALRCLAEFGLIRYERGGPTDLVELAPNVTVEPGERNRFRVATADGGLIDALEPPQ